VSDGAKESSVFSRESRPLGQHALRAQSGFNRLELDGPGANKRRVDSIFLLPARLPAGSTWLHIAHFGTAAILQKKAARRVPDGESYVSDNAMILAKPRINAQAQVLCECDTFESPGRPPVCPEQSEPAYTANVVPCL
jgi:hypothetical protein